MINLDDDDESLFACAAAKRTSDASLFGRWLAV
jgi:hypothetical protein